jgi:hypothetical protein
MGRAIGARRKRHGTTEEEAGGARLADRPAAGARAELHERAGGSERAAGIRMNDALIDRSNKASKARGREEGLKGEVEPTATPRDAEPLELADHGVARNSRSELGRDRGGGDALRPTALQQGNLMRGPGEPAWWRTTPRPHRKPIRRLLCHLSTSPGCGDNYPITYVMSQSSHFIIDAPHNCSYGPISMRIRPDGAAGMRPESCQGGRDGAG